MRIFWAFLIILCSVILWMLPFSEAVYDFRTDLRTDTFSTTTGVGVDWALETLLDDLYDCDTGSIDMASNSSTDHPLPGSFNCTTRSLNITGLTFNITRTLDITYDVNALDGYTALGILLDRASWIWMLLIICFAPAALVALFLGRA